MTVERPLSKIRSAVRGASRCRAAGYGLAFLLCLPLLGLPADAQSRDKTKKSKAKATKTDQDKWNAGTFAGLQLRAIGPAFMSGRIADIAIDPRDQSTWYVAVGSGNVWKTTNAGNTWTPIFEQEGSYSVGCVTVDPNRPDVIWLGTGENVSGRHVGFGDGVYRSLDGGGSWENMGLTESEHIGNIVVHPEDSNVVFVAAQGPLWSAGGDRGLFKTEDGGKTWNKILGGGDFTGVNEVHMDPRDPDVLYASTHQKFRDVAALINGGPESGIHKSTDGGKTWRELTGGLPAEDKGKIGLAISPLNPDVVYATVELAHREGGFYRSVDGGGSWEKRNDYISGATGPHYYQELFASPHQFDRVYQMDARMHFTPDGGRTMKPVGEPHKHGDNHAMAFDPNDPNYLLVGSDGGLYQSWDLGKNWSFVANLPVTQFYKVALDNDEPFYNIYGGTQDNNTQGGPSRTDNVHGIRNSDWFVTLFGDGHQPATDPSNPDIVYSEWQQGNLVRYDRSTGEIVYIQPQAAPGEPAERWNWDSPILVSPHDPARLYFASQRVWRSDNRGDDWRPISEDLSQGIDRFKRPMMGRVWSFDAIWDMWAMSSFGNVTSLSESPKVEGLIYAGTDDGWVQITEDGGETWRRSGELPGVPEFSFVNDIKADLHDADTVYVALDNHKAGDFKPYLLKSTDRGRSWTSITGAMDDGGLPDRHLVWRLVQDHVNPDLLFVGTEFGLFFSLEGGDRWIELSGNVPQIPFRDLAIQQRENDLVGATFGRGFYVFDDYSPLRQVTQDVLDAPATLFPVKDTLWYLQRQPLGGGEKATQGADFFTAPNPPFGAVFTYYLSEGLKSTKQRRQKEESEAKGEGKDTVYPGWEALHDEAKEDDPVVELTVTDAEGNVVRRLTGPASSGFHRVAWDLRYPPVDAWRSSMSEDFIGRGGGLLAPPGTYGVTLAKRTEDGREVLGESQSFQVTPLKDTILPRMDPNQAMVIMRKVEALNQRVSAAGAVLDDLEVRLQAAKQVIKRNHEGTELFDRVRKLEKRHYDLNRVMYGDGLKGDMGEPAEPTISSWLGAIGIGTQLSTYGPTPSHQKYLKWAESEFAKAKSDLAALLSDLDVLLQDMDKAGLPWTPGRGLQ